ncbi:MAG: nitrogen regulatory protein PII 1 [Candidatus Omnitrophota bacterium]|jgi:nitrogen regulatory protein PII 1
MKMLQAMIRPEKENNVINALENEGIYAMTKWDVVGRGQQHGIQVGSMHYDELPKVMLMLVIEDDQITKALAAIKEGAVTGNYGDGKIFVSPVSNTYTVRTGRMLN